MDEELEIVSEDTDDDYIIEAIWLPANNEEALRWEVLKLATSLTTHDKAIKLARDFEKYVTTGRSSPISVVKE